jgi:hypothetical protein
VNLAYRVMGTTGVCHTNPADEPVAETIADIAACYDSPLPAAPSSVPPTITPSDPDQCFEREDAATGDGTDASPIAQGLGDCAATGF